MFPFIVHIWCFLKSFTGIRKCCERLDAYPDLRQRVWEVYRAPDPATFREKNAALCSWAQETLSAGTGFEAMPFS